MSTEPSLTSSASTESRLHADYQVAMYRWQNIFNRSLGYLILIILTLLSAAPMLWMVFTSLRDRREVLGGPLLPTALTFEAYGFILSEFHIMTFLKNSSVVTLATIIIVVSLATLAGYAFARIDFWGRQLIFLTLLSTLMVPSTVLII